MKPTPAEVFRFLAEEEDLSRTLAEFPEITRDDLRSLLTKVADAARTREESVAPRKPAPSRPAEGGFTRLRIHSDGAARGNPGPAGAGAVLSTPEGEIVERLGKFLGSNTNNHAEYMGLIIGLARARELGAREVEVYADSELMIRQLQGRYQVKAENLKPLYAQARSLLQAFAKVKLAHVPRAQNAEADEMSNRAIDERM